jgi:uncharacterized protein YndB with AHSA1/START domain
MPVADAMATLRTADGRPVLRFERRLAHRPEKVWRAITDPAELAHWFPARIETELRAGAPIRFVFEHGPDPVVAGEADRELYRGEVLEVDPPRLFVYRWGRDVLRWEVVPDGQGSRLLFTQILDDRLAAARNAAGWDVCLEALAARLDGRPAERPPEGWLERGEQYIERFGLAEGEALDQPDGYLLRFERDLLPAREKVWAALTEPDGGRPGGLAAGAPPPPRLTNPEVPAGPVALVEPLRALEYDWLHDGAPAGRVRWELAESPIAGTLLTLTQTLPGRLADLRAGALAAWQTHLELLYATVHGASRPWPAGRVEELRSAYAERLARPRSAAEGAGAGA